MIYDLLAMTPVCGGLHLRLLRIAPDYLAAVRASVAGDWHSDVWGEEHPPA